MNLNEIIAVNLKRLRAERGFSLGKLSELSGVSKVMLSQIEKGESNPTINTLWKIAGGLQVSYTKLIDEQIDAPLLIRKEESVIAEYDGYRAYHYNTANPRAYQGHHPDQPQQPHRLRLYERESERGGGACPPHRNLCDLR